MQRNTYCVSVSILLPRSDNYNIYSSVNTPPIVQNRIVRKKRKSIFKCDEDAGTTESIERYMRATEQDGRDEYISSHHQQCNNVDLFVLLNVGGRSASVTFSENVDILLLRNRTKKVECTILSSIRWQIFSNFATPLNGITHLSFQI